MAATLQHCQCYSSCIHSSYIHIANVTLHASSASTLPMCSSYIHIANVLFIHPHCQCALHTSTLPMCSSYIHIANVLFIHPHCQCYSSYIHIANVTLHISTLPMLLFIYPHCQCYSSYIHISIVILDQSSCISLFRGFRNTESNLYWSWIMWWIF